MANWLTSESSLLIGVQGDYITPHATASEYKAIRCEKPTITTTGNVERLDTLDGSAGSAQQVIVGSKHGGEISFRMPLSGFATGYDSTTDVPGTTAGVVPEWLCLAANMLGSGVENITSSGSTLQDDFWKGVHLSAAPYSSGNISTGSTTSMVDATSATGYDAGEFVSFDGAAGADRLAGWIQSIATNQLNLIEALDYSAASSGSTRPSVTAYMSAQQPLPLCAIYTGDLTTASGASSSAAYRFTGMIGRGFTISMEAGQTPMIEFSYYYTNREQTNASGLVVPSARPRISPILGSRGGALRVDGAKKCLGSFSVSLECETIETMCHSAPQGVSAVVVARKTVAVSCSVPWDSSDAVSATGAHLWEDKLETETATQISVQTGQALGQMFGVLVPAAQQVEYPALSDQDGRLGYELSMEAAAYSADGGSTAPADTVFRIGMG